MSSAAEASRATALDAVWTHGDAAAHLVDVDYIRTWAYRRAVLRAPRELAHPLIIQFYLVFNTDLRKRGFPFMAYDFVRTRAHQDALVQQGRTKVKSADSPHCAGCAVDIVHARWFYDLAPEEWAIVTAMGLEVVRRRKWGITCDPFEPATWFLTDWKEVSRARG